VDTVAATDVVGSDADQLCRFKVRTVGYGEKAKALLCLFQKYSLPVDPCFFNTSFGF